MHDVSQEEPAIGFLLACAAHSLRVKKVASLCFFPKILQKSEMAYSSFTSIDWSRTKAYCSEVLASPPSIWINLKGVKPQGIVDPAEYDSLVDMIIEKLAELKDPRTGKPVINRVCRRNEIFHGPFANEGADLVLDWWSENSLFSTQPSFPKTLISRHSSFANTNLPRHPNGVAPIDFMASWSPRAPAFKKWRRDRESAAHRYCPDPSAFTRCSGAGRYGWPRSGREFFTPEFLVAHPSGLAPPPERPAAIARAVTPMKSRPRSRNGCRPWVTRVKKSLLLSLCLKTFVPISTAKSVVTACGRRTKPFFASGLLLS